MILPESVFESPVTAAAKLVEPVVKSTLPVLLALKVPATFVEPDDALSE